MITNNFIALVITFGLALTWLRLNNFAAQKGWISSDLSRKIIHIGTGPIFVTCWLLFNDQPVARYLATLVPLAITFQFVLVGFGFIRDPAAVQSMSRSGDRREILHGPLYYGIVFVVLTILYWRNSPIGIVALMLVCGGDGLADIFGRRMGKTKLPWNRKKTWVGSISMFLGGWLFSTLLLAIFFAFGMLPGNLFTNYLPVVTLIEFAASIVESLPLQDIDNLTIAITAVLLGHAFF